MSKKPWGSIFNQGKDLLHLEPPSEHTAKVGMDANLLAWLKDGMLLTAARLPADAPLDSGEIARNLPQGWDYEHFFGTGNAPAKLRALPPGLLRQTSAKSAVIALPQTATPAQQLVLTGLSLLVISGLLLLLRGRRHGHA